MTSKTRTPFLIGIAAVTLLSMPGCDLTRNHTKMDRDANLNVQDFRDALQPKELPAKQVSRSEYEEGIPSFDNYVAEPGESEKPVPLVSISVNQSVPLREVLFELSKQANMDIELDPNIKGSIILTARRKPFDVVVKRISEMAGLRYTFEDGILRVENDTPYQETYQLEYLNILRNTTSNVTTAVRIGGTGGQGTEGSTDTGSDYSLDTTSEGDFWTEIEENLSHILTEDTKAGLMKTDEDPRISVSVSQQAPVSSINEGQQAPPRANLNVQSLPTTSATSRSPGRRGGQAEAGAQESTFSINRQSGIITVYAPQATHKQVERFLDRVKELVTSQVLIEAKVLQVELTDEFSTGVNWRALDEGIDEIADATLFANAGSARPALSPNAINNFNIFAQVEDVNIFVDALSRFGTVRALASPRITVMNNQPAVLNVTESRVYFEIEIETDDEGAGDEAESSVEISSETFSVPEGVLINVHPSINLETNSTILAIKPTVTRVVNFVENPASAAAVALAQARTDAPLGELQTSVPELSVQEFDSVVKMNSGEVVVLGGLLEDRIESEREGVPVLGEVPVLGNLFRTQGDRIDKTELVVLIKTTVLKNAFDSIHDTDRELYKKFAGDRRPFDL